MTVMRNTSLHAIRDPIDIVLPCRSKIKRWAFENAIMLTVVFALFIIQLIGLFVLGVYVHARG